MHLKSAIHLFYYKYDSDKLVKFAQINENTTDNSRVYQSCDFCFLIVSSSLIYRYGKHSQYEKTLLSKVIDLFIIGHVFILCCFRGFKQKWRQLQGCPLLEVWVLVVF